MGYVREDGREWDRKMKRVKRKSIQIGHELISS